ncbi:MAG: ZIP family metal transporter [Thermomicrobiales bacterium]
MIDWFRDLDPVAQAALAGGFTWFVTALGAAIVLLIGRMSQRLLDTMLGFAAGVMIAASVWSLLIPSIELAEETDSWAPAWIPAAAGVLLGAAFLRVADQFMPHLHLGQPMSEREGVETAWRRTTLLILAITLHNIPEGLAVGVAFGALASTVEVDNGATLAGAVTLALGIGMQNFPEGLAVAMPLRREGVSRFKSFWYGQLSAVVEPVAAVLGALAVVVVSPILPYALAFAAGAMLYVVIEQLIPESQAGNHTDLATLGTMLGFVVMMALDVALA